MPSIRQYNSIIVTLQYWNHIVYVTENTIVYSILLITFVLWLRRVAQEAVIWLNSVVITFKHFDEVPTYLYNMYVYNQLLYVFKFGLWNIYVLLEWL